MIVAALLWAVNMQLGLILPYAECGSRIRPALIGSVIAVLLALGSGWLCRGAVHWPGPYRPVLVRRVRLVRHHLGLRAAAPGRRRVHVDGLRAVSGQT